MDPPGASAVSVKSETEGHGDATMVAAAASAVSEKAETEGEGDATMVAAAASAVSEKAETEGEGDATMVAAAAASAVSEKARQRNPRQWQHPNQKFLLLSQQLPWLHFALPR